MSLSNKKNIGAPASQSERIVKVIYDFADDGGTIADYDVLENTGTDACVVELESIQVETAVLSAGALVMDLGKGDGGVEFKSDLAKTTMAVDAMISSDAPNTKVYLANGEKVVLGLEAAAATAGKIHMVFKITRRAY